MDEMKSIRHHMLPEATGAFIDAEKLLAFEIDGWFTRHGAKLHPENHSLRLNPVRVSWSPERTRYERTADLILRQAIGHPDGKVLKKNVLTFTVEWPNPQEDTGGSSETETQS